MSLGQNDNALLKIFADEELRKENAALAAENERIAVELEQRCRELNLSLGQQGVQLRQIGELTAENERLRKAGDVLAARVKVQSFYKSDLNIVDAWNAAKEGRDAK